MIDVIELPEGVRTGNEKLILVTASAGSKLRALADRGQEGDFLRVKITGGGCNGLSYKMKFVDAPSVAISWSGPPVPPSWSIPKARFICGAPNSIIRISWSGAVSSSATRTPNPVAVAVKALVFRVESGSGMLSSVHYPHGHSTSIMTTKVFTKGPHAAVPPIVMVVDATSSAVCG